MHVNPILAEVSRCGMVESFHRGAYVVTDKYGEVIASAGDIISPIFPRSAIKALQALPVILSGAAKANELSQSELALICASHNGEVQHVENVKNILRKADIPPDALECGAHWPTYPKASGKLARTGEKPTPLHNNCSGKHAGMLLTAKYLGEEMRGYIEPTHGVQKRIKQILSEFCESELSHAPCGIDGCSVPTWAMPLQNMALAFSRFADPVRFPKSIQYACAQIISATRSTPFMTAGTDRLCTKLMNHVPRLYAKTGAEGVYCGAIAHAGIGIAVKCDDGAKRASEVIFSRIAAMLDVWREDERRLIDRYSTVELKNRNGKVVGELRATTRIETYS